MKKTLLIFALPLVLASCGTNNEQKPSENANQANADTKPSDLTFGIYSDTLPCSDCPGILTELTILPDTTYRLSERKLGPDGRPNHSEMDRGIYSFPSDGKIKLTSRKEGNPERIFEVGDKNFKTTQAVTGSSSSDLTVELAEEIKGKKNGEFVYYKISPFNGHPTMVYNFVRGNDVHISKSYLDIAPESEKAIVAYYAAQYNTGCEGANCALSEALAMDDAAMKSLVTKWMPTETLHPRSADAQLALLFIMQNGNQFQVNYNVMDKDMAMMGASDVFTLKENQFTVDHKPLTSQGGRPNKSEGKTEKKPSGKNKR